MPTELIFVNIYISAVIVVIRGLGHRQWGVAKTTLIKGIPTDVLL